MDRDRVLGLTGAPDHGVHPVVLYEPRRPPRGRYSGRLLPEQGTRSVQAERVRPPAPALVCPRHARARSHRLPAPGRRREEHALRPGPGEGPQPASPRRGQGPDDRASPRGPDRHRERRLVTPQPALDRGSRDRRGTVTSVLQDWVMALPLREQGTLLTAVRGCDDEPKAWTATG